MIETTNTSRLAWKLGDAAIALGVGQSTLRKEVAQGRLKSVRMGRRILIEDSVLRAYVGAAAAANGGGEGPREAAEGLRPTA
jgi:excisionase family DNA binding protein